MTHFYKSVKVFCQKKRGKNPWKGKGWSLTFWSLKSCYPSGTLPFTHLAIIGPEMINVSHCGFWGVFKNRRKRNVARMWPVWVSGYIYLYEKIKALGHAIVNATTRVPQISRLPVPREQRNIFLLSFIIFYDYKYSRLLFWKKKKFYRNECPF